jgi:hypothetical protein
VSVEIRKGVPRGRYDPEQLRRVRGGTTAAEMLKDVLQRQQAQLQDAQKQQQRAEKNAQGHIMAMADGTFTPVEGAGNLEQGSMEDGLAGLTNAAGNWDDSEDEDDTKLSHSVSRVTLTSASSYNDVRSGDDSTAVDVWDL